MAICIYDNPATWRREQYRDGILECFINFEEIWQNPFLPIGWSNFAHFNNVEEGRIYGDPSAMLPNSDAKATASTAKLPRETKP